MIVIVYACGCSLTGNSGRIVYGLFTWQFMCLCVVRVLELVGELILSLRVVGVGACLSQVLLSM